MLPVGAVGLEGLLGVTAFDVDTGTGKQIGDGGCGLGGVGHAVPRYDGRSTSLDRTEVWL
jgi:hypothetical protein